MGSQPNNMKMKIPLMLASLILSMTSVSSEDADLWIKELRVKTGYEHNAGMDGCCVRFVIYNKESGVCVTNNVDPPGEDMEAGQLDIIGADGGLGECYGSAAPASNDGWEIEIIHERRWLASRLHRNCEKRLQLSPLPSE